MSFKQSLVHLRGLSDLPALACDLGFEPAWHPFEAGAIGSMVLVGRRHGFLAFGLQTDDPPRTARRVARWVTGRGISGVVLALAPARRDLALSVTGLDLPVATIGLDRVRALDERILARAAAIRHESPLAAAAAWADALAGQSLGDRFFAEFRRALDHAVAALPRAIPARDRHALALLSLTRVLFLYFVQERGWLDGRPRFLREELDACLAGSGGVESRLLSPLFFGTLNRPADRRTAAAKRFGRIPFLNGGLFERHPLESRWDPRLPDSVWRDAFDRLFERYHFTIAEDDPCRTSIGPDMLGRVFERVMDPDARRDSGAFFTPSELVDRVVDQAMVRWLAGRLDAPIAETRERLGRPDPRLRSLLDRVTILDPAVGSGAFLLGALKWLVAARVAQGDPSGLATRAIVRTNLFGVDRNPSAVRLAELRLWLAVIQADPSETPEAVAPLPNLDALVRQGDSVVDPVQLPFLAVAGEGPSLAALRRTVVDASGPAKARAFEALRRSEVRAARVGVDAAIATLEGRIAELVETARSPTLFDTRGSASQTQRRELHLLRRDRTRLRTTARRLARADEVPWFHFATHFADVIEAGGFELVIGNPPWVRAEQLAAPIRSALKARYRWFRAGPASGGYRHLPDVSVVFLERAIELLAPGGVVAFLVPAKLLTAQYATAAREGLARGTTLEVVAALEGDGGFDAMVYPLALVASRRRPGIEHRVQVGLDGNGETVPQASLGASPWGLGGDDPAFARIAPGPSLGDRYQCRLGVKTGADRIFLDPDAAVDERWLRPALRGRDVKPFSATPSAKLLWTHEPSGVPAGCLPATVSQYLETHRRVLERRADYRGGPIGTVFRIEGAVARHRVIWSDLSRELSATPLIGPDADAIIPLNTCYLVATESDAAALALAAWLNSGPIRALARRTATVAGSGYRRFDAATVSRLPLPPAALGDERLIGLARAARRTGRIDHAALNQRVGELLGIVSTTP